MTRIDLGNVKGSKGDAIQIKDLTSAEKKELLAYSNLELTDKEIQEAFDKLTDSQQDRIKGDKGDKGDKGTLDYEVCSQNPLNTYYNHIIKAYYDSQTKEFHKSTVEDSPNIISIIEGYYDDGKFYEDANLTNEMELMENTIYHDLTNQEDYHSYNGSLMLESEFTYVDISKDDEKIKGYYNSANSQFYLERNFETLIEGNDEEEYLDLITGDTYNYNGFVWTRIEPVYDTYRYTDDGFVLYNGGKVPIPTKLYIYNPTGETGEYDNQVNDIYFYIESVIEDVKYGRFINLFNSEISNSLTVNSIEYVDIVKNNDNEVILEFYVNNYFKDIVEVDNISSLSTGEEDKIYVDSNGKAYRWSGSSFVEITTFDLDARIDVLEENIVTKSYVDDHKWTKEDITNFAHTHDIEDIVNDDDMVELTAVMTDGTTRILRLVGVEEIVD